MVFLLLVLIQGQLNDTEIEQVMMYKYKIFMIIFFLIYVTVLSISHAKDNMEIFLQTGHSDGVNSVCFSPDGKFIASGSQDSTIKLWNVKELTLIRTFKGHSNSVESVIFSPDCRYIASGSYDKTIKIWNVKDGYLNRTFRGHENAVKSLCFSPDVTCIASGDINGFNLWDVKKGALIRSFEGSSSDIESLSFSSDGTRIAEKVDHNTINLWDIKNGILIRTFKEHSFFSMSVSFSPNGKHIVSRSNDHTIKLWNVKNETLIRIFKGHEDDVNSIGFSPDGKYIVSGSNDHSIKLWNVKDGTLVSTFRGHSSYVKTVNFSPDGKHIVSAGSSDGTLNQWNLKDGILIRSLKGHDASVLSVNFCPDGRRIVSGSKQFGGNEYATIKVWNVKDGSIIRTFKFYYGLYGAESVRFSPDGKLLASHNSKIVNLWNVEDGIYIRTFNPHFREDWEKIKSINFTPDGRHIVTGYLFGYIRLWNIKDGTFIDNSLDSTKYEYIDSQDLSPDGRRIASGCYNKRNKTNTIKLFNVKDGTLIRTFRGHKRLVYSLCFSPDGRFIASGSLDNTIILWNVNNEKDSFVFTSLPDNEWITFKSGQPYYNSSPNGDKYAAIRFNNDTFNYKPLSRYRNKYKRERGLFQSDAPALLTKISHQKTIDTDKLNILQEKKISKNNLLLKLNCKHEGKTKDAFDIDEDINIYAQCPKKQIKINYNEDLKMFTGIPQCSSGTIHIDAFKFEKQSFSFNQNNKEFQVQMNFKKPFLYLMINPSDQLNIPPLNYDTEAFNRFKNEIRLMSEMLDGRNRYWDQYLYCIKYFYSHNTGNTPVLLRKEGNTATRWNDPDFINRFNKKIVFNKKNKGFTYEQLIDDALQFFKGFSISDQLNLKGTSLFIIGSPESEINAKSLNMLEQKLMNHKICAFIVQFGKHEKVYTDNTFRYLKIIEYDVKKEFYNAFFKAVFKKIMTEFESLFDSHQ